MLRSEDNFSLPVQVIPTKVQDGQLEPNEDGDCNSLSALLDDDGLHNEQHALMPQDATAMTLPEGGALTEPYTCDLDYLVRFSARLSPSQQSLG